jgi:hypothetical protein
MFKPFNNLKNRNKKCVTAQLWKTEQIKTTWKPHKLNKGTIDRMKWRSYSCLDVFGSKIWRSFTTKLWTLSAIAVPKPQNLKIVGWILHRCTWLSFYLYEIWGSILVSCREKWFCGIFFWYVSTASPLNARKLKFLLLADLMTSQFFLNNFFRELPCKVLDFFVFLLRIYLEFPSRMLSTHTFVYVSVIDMLTLSLYEIVENLEEASRTLKNSKWTIWEKLISAFDQPLVKAHQQLIECSWLSNLCHNKGTTTTNKFEIPEKWKMAGRMPKSTFLKMSTLNFSRRCFF